METPREYYTYAYLREDRTPYYIGKGNGRRLYIKHNKEIRPPKDKSRIIYLKQNLLEEDAFKHEIYMIDVFGRKDLGTGILRNRTNGGEGVSGLVTSEETRRKRSERMRGENNPHYGKRGQNSLNYGKSPSDETRRKISEKNTGVNSANYGKRGKNSFNYGKSPSEETRRKQSEVKKGKNNPNYGKSHSEEAKRKMSEKKKGIIRSEKSRKKQGETIKGENNHSYGKKWWNDNKGNSKRSVECPGDGWISGRGKIKNKD
jgi:hypothetical protein